MTLAFKNNDISEIHKLYNYAEDTLDVMPKIHDGYSEIMMAYGFTEKAFQTAKKAVDENKTLYFSNKCAETAYDLGLSNYNVCVAIDNDLRLSDEIKFKYLSDSFWYLSEAEDADEAFKPKTPEHKFWAIKGGIYLPLYYKAELLILNSFPILIKSLSLDLGDFDPVIAAYFHFTLCSYFMHRTIKPMVEKKSDPLSSSSGGKYLLDKTKQQYIKYLLDKTKQQYIMYLTDIRKILSKIEYIYGNLIEEKNIQKHWLKLPLIKEALSEYY